MFYKFLLSLCFSALSISLYACNACGGGINQSSVGLLPQLSGHFIGLQYFNSSTHSITPSLFENKAPEERLQNLHYAQLWARYQLHECWQLYAYLPYLYNQSTNTQSKVQEAYSGIGDAGMWLSYSLIKTKKEKGAQHLLMLGLGVKTPTGSFNFQTATSGTAMAGMQTGSGSWDIICNTNYTLTANKIGINLDANLLLTQANANNYKYGNKLSNATTIYYNYQKGALLILPQLSLRNEYSLKDYDNYSKYWRVENSGGILCSIGAGFQIQYRQLGFRSLYFKPYYQHYANGLQTNQYRLECGLYCLL